MWRMAMLIALMAAILKDLLDYVGIGSLPAIGYVVTICVSFVIGIMIFIAGSGNKKRNRAKSLIKKLVTLGGGTIVESLLFGLNFLPIETLTVIVLYRIVKKEKAAEARLLAEEKRAQTEAYAGAEYY